MTSVRKMPLFDDFERTHPGRSDRLHESEFDYLNRSARPEAAEARNLCERWFVDFATNATDRHLNDLRSRFRNKRLDQHHGAWFELLTSQILVRLGFDVMIHPHIPGICKRPDFMAVSDSSRILVEATAAGVKPALPYPEEDAMQKLADLASEDFDVSIDRTEGELRKLLTRNRLLDPFKRLLRSHDPDEVQRLTDNHGESVRPRCTICFGEWKLFVSLWPASPSRRQPRDNRVIPARPQPRNHTYVPDARKRINEKLGKYGQVDDTLVIAVTAYRLGNAQLASVAHDTLFGDGGIWDSSHSPGKAPAAVLFFSNSKPYDVPAIQARLHVNPSVDPVTLPPALLRLPRAQGADGSERFDGESVASILDVA